MMGGKTMKRLSMVILALLLLAGCSSSGFDKSEAAEKKCKMEIYSAQDDTLLNTVDDQEQLKQLLAIDTWETADEKSEGLTPEYKLCVYQEKTLLAGQSPDDERDYELIETLTTFRDSTYVEAEFSPEVIKNMKLSEEYLTFYYLMPEKLAESLREAV